MEEKKRLTRSNNGMIGGVCAGLAEYLNLDPTIVRIVWVLMVLFAGFGILLYVILWLVMPKQQIG
ncbi:PspC domain-containing protein [Parabacteroides distasonis]|uniref:PspC domain-containing protein n=1 Tax=Parabacteroides distasonis TaxID=823 RepID=UPI0018A10CA3|nr:PspC domain-containing protein [Parabacteroides distasonis]MDB9153225.1 PspC domain-containing protein [Parabacteroides distasonis]MDB9157797.1 PspC domain-containing protein [Parabacteroides distasonis]MDB9166662.1 PspC domain-containing protein [Parabacteroides distasonis]MDB9171081.1 PspC domain-containing protein [Parabacteroides distasonis]MDB9193793.1 PspC domain-containing protein [Parabacteroides distasonis]